MKVQYIKKTDEEYCYFDGGDKDKKEEVEAGAFQLIPSKQVEFLAKESGGSL